MPLIYYIHLLFLYVHRSSTVLKNKHAHRLLVSSGISASSSTLSASGSARFKGSFSYSRRLFKQTRVDQLRRNTAIQQHRHTGNALGGQKLTSEPESLSSLTHEHHRLRVVLFEGGADVRLPRRRELRRLSLLVHLLKAVDELVQVFLRLPP